MEQKKRGRKPTYAPEVQQMIIEEYLSSATKDGKAGVLEKYGVSTATLYRWVDATTITYYVRVGGGEITEIR
ncbi:hypothetical protein [Edwardsiella tarda]|uniref:Transposase n=1 Tax=Edwardsiella tarda TaxID=636 RepID=A0A2A7U7M2_EDWTA|nr:hypothetical protein [Edwardsiella tarda]PEH74278.1 hypothetical protein CRM76_01150 [Edwardsiella tarda]